MTKASDIAIDEGPLRYLPGGVRPFALLARWDRPIGTWLLLWPCLWGLVLAERAGAGGAVGTAEMAGWLALFTLGAFVMRGAGCTINDIFDRDIDAKVARTAGRPLASGAISLTAAMVFLAAQLLVGLIILLQLNPLCWALGVVILVVVFTYPLMKRVTYWPQLFLGIAFNWGAVMGWAAVTGAVAPAALALYLGGIAWTLGYDTIYAHQDKEDDALIGVKSTALRLGDGTRPWLWGFYAAALAGIAGAAWLAGLGWPSFAVLALAGGHLAWQVMTVDLDAPAACLAVFKSNRLFGALVMGALALG